LARLQTLAEQALDQVRAVSHSLHPPDWQGLTTADALHHLIQSSGLIDLLEVEIDIQPLPLEPSHAVKIAIYRCAQECISNVTRHSGATRFSLALMAQGPMVELRLEDNGHGFPQESSGKGIGLPAMREHAMELGGVCEIRSGADGVRICVRLPFTAD
jgi:signal transduction histidine kinase